MSSAQSQLIGLIEIDAAAAPLADHLSLQGMTDLLGGRCGGLAELETALAGGLHDLRYGSPHPPEPTRWPSKAWPRPFRHRSRTAVVPADLSQLHEDLNTEFSRFLARLAQSRHGRRSADPGAGTRL